MSGLAIYSGCGVVAPNKIRLTKLPGDRVMTQQMSFRVRDVERYGGKEQVFAFVKEALKKQFRLRDKDVAILQTVDANSRGEYANFCCLAYLKGNDQPSEMVAAMKFYRDAAAADDGTNIPDYIDV